MKKSNKNKREENKTQPNEEEIKSSEIKNNISIQAANVFGGENYQAGRDIYIK